MNELEVRSHRPRVAYYADDFTGATDSLAFFATAGLTARLFVDPRSLAQYLAGPRTDADVVGLAGVARDLGGHELEREVTTALELLRSSAAPVVQYKVCSTFDSNAERGSIGRAIEIGARLLDETRVVVAPAQPDYGRYTFGGNHFAVDRGTGELYRLDRHPTMSVHPSTPMDEADLRRVLQNQTTMPSALVSWPDVLAHGGLGEVLNDRTGGPSIVVCDAMSNADLAHIVAALDCDRTRFVVGSGGLSRAIAARFASDAGGRKQEGSIPGATPVLVVSGSLSSLTSRQIAKAATAGWHHLSISAHDGDPHEVIAAACDALSRGRDVIVDSIRDGETDRDCSDWVPASPEVLGGVLAEVVRQAVSVTGVRRVVVAGGDTSGYVLRALGAQSLSLVSVLQPGVSLCRVTSTEAGIDGLEVVLKGGQMGEENLFDVVRNGSGHSAAHAKNG